MAAHASHQRLEDDNIQLGDRFRPLSGTAMVVGAIGLVASVALGFFADADHSFRRFLYAYLASYGYFLSIGLGSLIFVIIQHLTKAGWSVNVRRIAEALTSTMPLLAVLSIPLIISVALQNGTLYRWALPMSAAEQHGAAEAHAVHSGMADEAKAVTPAEEATQTNAQEGGHPAAEATAPEHEPVPGVLDEETLTKRHYLNPGFFLVRMAIYLVVWCGVSSFYRKQSLRQDVDGELVHTERMQTFAPMAAILTMLTLTFGAVDLLMSLDPLWYSTIFGVYYFAGCAIAIFATLSVASHALQTAGYLRRSLTTEHYHDLGKLLFAFVFFWGYIAFAQYMLLWYGNIPEETAWWRRHGATTVSADVTIWSYVIVVILFGKCLIPFAGLLSRHVKRNKAGLIFWSVWLLAFQALDIFWIVMPQLGKYFNAMTLVIYLLTTLGMGGVMLAMFLRALGANSLRPLRDPRLPESMAFTNI